MAAGKSEDPPDQQQFERLIQEAEPELYESIPERKRSKLARLVQFVAVSFSSGPLPPPEQFGKYNEIVPGAAERIIRMAIWLKSALSLAKALNHLKVTRSGRNLNCS